MPIAVVDQGEEQVLADVAHGGAGQGDRGRHSGQGAGDQGDVGGLDGHVGAGADRQADVGLGKGGGVVDAVADHADPAALRLQAADLVGLVLGQDLGQHPRYADLGGDRGGGAGVVAGDHHHADAEVAQGGDRGGRVGFDGVGDGEDAGRACRRRRPGSASCPGRPDSGGHGVQRGGVDTDVAQQPRGADQNGVAGDGGLHALAGDRVEPARGRQGQAAVVRAGDDRGGEGVFAVGLGGGDQPPAAGRRSNAPIGWTSVRAGLPAVMVPVLSSTIVSSLLRGLQGLARSGSGCPAWAPLPVPTMIDSGVARPSAQGQAMISTATADTSASGERRWRAGDEPDGEGDDRDGDHGGDEVVRRWRRRGAGSAPWRLGPAAPAG